MRTIWGLTLAAVLMVGLVACKEEPKVPTVVEGDKVSVHYKLTVDGEVIDSSEGRGPLDFTVGAGQMIKGFDASVLGMKAGEKKSFTVAPEDGYGIKNAEMMQEVPKSALPPGTEPQVGMQLQGTGPNGEPLRFVIAEVKKDAVVLDLNHPLADKTLNFEVEMVSITPAVAPAK